MRLGGWVSAAQQTMVDPCAFCGEAAVEILELTPAIQESRGGVVQVKRPLMSHVCPGHAEAIRRGCGWQERMKDKNRHLTREAKERLARDQGRLW